MEYYYFAASLPMPSFDQPPPLPLKRFLELCAEHLLPGDRRAVEEVLAEEGPVAHPLARRWQDFETQLRNAAARTRAARARRDAAACLRKHEGFDLALERAVAEAFSRENPLARERALDLARWRAAESFAGADPFALPALLAYALKLRLLERWAAMTDERGHETVERLLRRDSPEARGRPPEARGREAA